MKDCKFFKNEVFVRKYKDYRKNSLYNNDVNKEVGIERYYKLKFIIALTLAFGGLYLVSPLGVKNNLTNLVCLNNVYESVEDNISKKYLTNESFDISNINLKGCSFAYIQSEKDMFDSINNLGSSSIDIKDAEIISNAISKILTQSRIFVGFLYFSIFIILTFSIYILKETYVHNKNTVKIYDISKKGKDKSIKITEINLVELEASIDFRHDVIIDTIQLVIIGSIISTLSMFSYEGIIISILKVLPLLIISIYKSYIRTYVSK